MIEARIILTHASPQRAKAIASSLAPDNPAGNLLIVTRTRGNQTVTIVKRVRTVDSLVLTLNDLISCAQAAENTLARAGEK